MASAADNPLPTRQDSAVSSSSINLSSSSTGIEANPEPTVDSNPETSPENSPEATDPAAGAPINLSSSSANIEANPDPDSHPDSNAETTDPVAGASGSGQLLSRSSGNLPLDPFAGHDSSPVRRLSLEEVQFEDALRASLPEAETEGQHEDDPPVEPQPAIQPTAASKSSGATRRSSQQPIHYHLTSDSLSVLQSPIMFNTNEFIQTASGNKVAVKSVLCGSHKIHMAGKSIIHTGVVLRGDLASLRIGKFVSVGKGSTLRPAFKSGKNTFGYIPMSIGDYVTVGEDCVISAASISNHVVIGDNCVIGKRCILKDCCAILPGAVLPPDTVVPPMTAFGGVPARFVGDLFESAALTQKKTATDLYRRFLPKAP